ncbi:MAG: hypothetical protein E7445_10345 [Ruminococcaceae bacterium]|nr:hypothetical protein [Oscillospiraceae bacterium]
MRASAQRTALCGLLAAVSVVCLMMGSLIPAALYACPILAMAALLPLREQFGHSAALTTYASVSVLALLLVPDKELALLYGFFGWYVPLQPALDRLQPRPLRAAVKLALANLAMLTLYGLLIFIFQMQSVLEELEGLNALWLIILLLSANCLFILTDILLHRLARKWSSRFHQHK